MRVNQRSTYRAIKGVRTCYRKFAFCTCAFFVCLNYLRKVLSITLDGSLLILPNSARLSTLKRRINTTCAQNTNLVHYLLCGEQTGGLLLLLLLHKIAELGSRAEPVHHRLHLNSKIELRNKQDTENAQKT